MIGVIPYALCFVLLGLLFLLIPRKSSTRRLAVVLLILSLLGELCICNFHSFHLLGGGYTPFTPELTDSTVHISGGQSQAPLTTSAGGTLTVTLEELDRPVGTLHLKLTLSEGAQTATVKVSAKDVTQAASWRSNVADGTLVRGDDRSSYMVLDLSGEVSALKIAITAPQKATLTLESLTLNETIPLRFSALRLVLFFLGCMAVYALVTFPSMKQTYRECPAVLRYAAWGLTALLILTAVGITWVSMYDQTGGVSTGFRNTWGNQITQELVDAFRAGQVHLIEEPSQALLDMENPYDWSARRAQEVNAKWDHLLFEGKYYSYYGIAPVLLLYLPYSLLTGYYFPAAESILLFGGLGILFLTLLFLEFSKLFCKDIPNSMLLSTLVILQLSSGVWFNFVYDNFYEIAQASGFFFTCAGFFFLLRSRILGEGRIRLPSLTLGTVCLSWGVLCRPTLAVYCIVACIFLVFGVFKRRREALGALSGTQAPSPSSKKVLRKATLTYLLAALTPFVLIGGIQVIYNVARFGNPLDFGIQYSLTINDFTRSQYHTDFAMIGFFNFLFTFPRIQPEFPYFASQFSTLSTNGYYFVANRNAMGLLWRALPSLGYLGAWPAWRVLSRKERRDALWLLLPLCLLAPIVIIFSIWESGYGVRYCCDFAWQFILGGAAILFLLYSRKAQGQGRDILRNAFTLAMVLGIMVNGAMIYEYLSKTGELAGHYLRLSRIFDFWL